jgi:uncharacterized protein (DUF58 family)
VPRLTARGIAFLIAGGVLGAIAYLFERPEVLPIAAMAVAAPLIALIVVATSRPQLRVSRQLQPVVATEGEHVQVLVSVAGKARAAEWTESVPMAPGFAGPGRLRDISTTRPGSLGYRYWPSRRGWASVGPLIIEDRDPFALAVRETNTRAVSTQLVIPKVSALTVGPMPGPSAQAGPQTARSRERADDDVVTREYRSGDALRRVHWRVTARHGELMVRQEEPQAGPHARLIVDTQTVGYRDVALVRDPVTGRRAPDSASFEWSIRMAASTAVHLAERGYTVQLLSTAEGSAEKSSENSTESPAESVAEAPIAEGPVGDVLGALALAALGQRAGDLSEHGRNGSSPVVVIAGEPDDVTAQWMLSQRHSRAPALALLVGLPLAAARPDGSVDADPVRSAFERAGWVVARVSVAHAPDEAWLALLGGGSTSRMPRG